MDSLDVENSKSEAVKEEKKETVTARVKTDDMAAEMKSGKKKRRKRSLMKKNKNLHRKSVSANELSTATAEVTESLQDSLADLKTSDFATDRSSLDSSASDPELREVQ